MRGLIAGAVVALHVLLLLLLASGLRPRDRSEPSPVFVSLAVALPPQPALLQPSALRAVARSDERISAPEPIEPIELGPPEPSLAPRVDWLGEATAAAGRATKPVPDAKDAFAPPPKALREPCKPRETHMEWNGHEDRRVGFSGGLPFVKLGKRCVVGLGFFGCALGELPQGNGHILDDRMDPERSSASVPDHATCD